MVNLRKNASGNLVKKAGSLVLGTCAECNECTHCESCAEENQPSCPGGGCCTPSRWKLVVTGVEAGIPVGCFDCPFHGESAEVLTYPPIDDAGGHTLLQVDTCEWRKTLGIYTLTIHHEDATCSGSPECDYTGTLEIILRRATSGLYGIKIEGTATVDGGEDVSCNSSVSSDVFSDLSGSATAGRCDEDVSFTNANSLQCASNNFDFSDTGSATASVCP